MLERCVDTPLTVHGDTVVSLCALTSRVRTSRSAVRNAQEGEESIVPFSMRADSTYETCPSGKSASGHCAS